MPPYNEHTISTPLPEGELRQVIHDAYGDDESTAMLTQVLFCHYIYNNYLLMTTVLQNVGTFSVFGHVCTNRTTTIFGNVKASSWFNYSSNGR